MKKIDTNTKRTNRVIESVGASLAFEGLKPSRRAKNLGKQFLENTISGEEAVAKIKAMHSSSFGR